MLWHRFARASAVLFATLAAVISLASMTATAHAAAPRLASATPSEGTKVVLGDTSIDGPALATTYTPHTVLAWTGTDSGHSLNVMTSSDGLHYGNKHILDESSLWRPAVAFIDSGRGAPYGTIVLAWTGTDTNHTLNLMFIKTPDFTITRKITLWGEWSFTAPALTTINSDLKSDIYLAWAGTDSAHTVNVMHLSTDSEQTDKRTLWGWRSISRPNLATDQSSGDTSTLLLSWTGVNHRIYFANSTDRVHWTMPDTSPLSVQTDWAPSIIGIATASPPGIHWLAWAGNGTSPTGNVNVQTTLHYPAWTDADGKASLDETAISSPALAIYGDGPTRDVLIAWTGTDYYHHLNVAIVSD
jgi:hypothetical protein